MKVFTIGFTRKTAERFFSLVKEAGVKRILDVRLHNRSQLAGFSKAPDLQFFLRSIADIEYAAVPDLAPTPELLEAYQKKQINWADYESHFISLLATRRVDETLDRSHFLMACLLCSEHLPKHCHRRLAAEFLQEKWGNLEIHHLQ